jgi:hypothetical protein
MARLDARRISEVVAAAKNFSRTAEARGASVSTLPQSTRASAVAAEHLARIGLDDATMERELAAERAENHRRLEELKADAVAQSAARAESLRRLVGDQLARLDRLVATTGTATTQYLGLNTPIEIWTTDGLNLESSTIQPNNSRAKIHFDASFYHGLNGAYLTEMQYVWLHFYYLWGNPRQDADAVVTVNAVMILNGSCSAHSQGGLVKSGRAALTLDPTLDLVQPWTQPISSAPPQAGETQNALNLIADSTGNFTSDQTTHAAVFRGFILTYDQAIVPPGQYLIIDVALKLGWATNNGEVHADFATNEFDVMCPFVTLAIPALPSNI